jgi:ATP-dependent Clp protease protease subunit
MCETCETSNNFIDKVFEESLNERKIILNEDISEYVIERVVVQILKFNKQDKGLPIEQRKPIYLYINSCGGEIANGYAIIDTIETSKTPVYGVVIGYAYSMGGLILLACHKKIGFKNSTILLHDGSMGVSTSGSKSKDVAKFYDTLNDRIKEFVVSKTKMTPEFYDSKYEKEFYMYANAEAKELGVIDFIVGEDVDLDEII